MKPTLTGPRVTLRAPVPSDKQDRLALGRDAEIVRMFGGSAQDATPLTLAEVEIWYANVETEPYGWMIEHEGKCVGSVRLHDFDEGNQSAWYAIGILDRKLLDRRLGREVTALVLAYAFQALDLLRVDLRVLAFNVRAIRSYEGSGFTRQTINRNAVQVDGEWHDDVIMSMKRKEWDARPT